MFQVSEVTQLKSPDVLPTNLSIVTKGNSCYLLKQSAKRRRSKQQIIDEKAQAEREKQEIDEKLANFEELQQRMAAMQEKVQRADEIGAQVHGLFQSGILVQNANGEVEVGQQNQVQQQQ